MDMNSYGKISGLSMAVMGASTFGVSLLYSFMTSKFSFFTVNYVFFAVAIIFMGIASAVCFSFQEQAVKQPAPTRPKKISDLKIFKNKKRRP